MAAHRWSDSGVAQGPAARSVIPWMRGEPTLAFIGTKRGEDA